MVPGPLSARGASACLGRPSSRFGLAMGLLASPVTSVCLCKNSYCLLWAETLCAEFLCFIKSCDCLSDPDGWYPILRVRTQVKEQLAQGHAGPGSGDGKKSRSCARPPKPKLYIGNDL